MYYYIVNPAAGNRALDSIQDKLKATLHSLQIDGEFAKTLGPGDAARITEKALTRGAKTIVAVGGDNTVREIINTLHKNKETEVALGIIPLGKKNVLASHLGIHNWKQACNVLAVRRISEYQFMRANRARFIFSARFTPYQPPIEDTDEGDLVKPITRILAKIIINNDAQVNVEAEELRIFNQKFLDTSLENQLVLQVGNSTQIPNSLLNRIWSIFKNADNGPTYSQLIAKKIEIDFPQPVNLALDGKQKKGTHFELSASGKPIRLITARQNDQNRKERP